MVFNLWSILLIGSASQCLFLMVLFLIKPPTNKKALTALMLLLATVLAITINNLWYAGHLYRSIQSIAGFTRGMTLFLGPLFYLYTLSIVKADFKFRWSHLLHLVPYLLAWVLISEQNRGMEREDIVVLLDEFVANGRPAGPLFLTRYSLYIVHLLVYFFLARKQMKLSVVNPKNDLIISVSQRIGWLKLLTWLLIFLAASQSFFIVKALSTGYYNIYGNFALTLTTSAFVYMAAYQAILNKDSLLPDFQTKYSSVNIDEGKRQGLIKQLLSLFETEKIFINPNLKASDVAERLKVPTHVLSTLINKDLNKTFFELLNQYRVEEFIRIAADPKYAKYSIMGIANEVGFNSKSSFNTAFKKHSGLTPSEYLKQAAN